MPSLIQKHAQVKGQRSNNHIFKFQPNPSWAKKRPNRYTSFKVGSSYMLQNVTVKICMLRFALTPKKLHISLDDKYVVLQSIDNKSFKSPLNLIPVNDAAQISHGETKCNIAGTIVEKQWQDTNVCSEHKESFQSNHLKLKLRDTAAD